MAKRESELNRDDHLTSGLKVLQLISSGGFYGAENVVLQLSTALKRRHCQVAIGTFLNQRSANTEIAGMGKARGLETELFSCAGRMDLSTVHTLREYLLSRQINILHTHGYKADLYGLLAVRRGSAKQVATAHNWPGKGFALTFYGVVDRLLLRQVPHVCAVSPNVTARLSKYGIPADRLSLIPNGVDVEQFSGGQPVLKCEPEFQGKTIIGFVGRLAEEKALPVLIQAAQQILGTRPDVSFAVVGEGPERPMLEALVDQLGLKQKMIFLGQRSDLADLYASFDIFVLPSLVEAMPMAILEAMAAGKAVVASAVGGVPSIVCDQESGLLVKPADVAELVHALTQLLNKPEQAKKFGEHGRELIKKRFSSDAMALSYLDVYAKVLQ